MQVKIKWILCALLFIQHGCISYKQIGSCIAFASALPIQFKKCIIFACDFKLKPLLLQVENIKLLFLNKDDDDMTCEAYNYFTLIVYIKRRVSGYMVFSLNSGTFNENESMPVVKITISSTLPIPQEFYCCSSSYYNFLRMQIE